MTIVEIQFVPNGPTSKFLSPVRAEIGARYVVPGANEDSPQRMGTVVATHGDAGEDSELPAVTRSLFPGEDWDERA